MPAARRVLSPGYRTQDILEAARSGDEAVLGRYLIPGNVNCHARWALASCLPFAPSSACVSGPGLATFQGPGGGTAVPSVRLLLLLFFFEGGGWGRHMVFRSVLLP